MAFICKLKARNQIKREERGEKDVNDSGEEEKAKRWINSINRIIIHLS